MEITNIEAEVNRLAPLGSNESSVRAFILEYFDHLTTPHHLVETPSLNNIRTKKDLARKKAWYVLNWACKRPMYHPQKQTWARGWAYEIFVRDLLKARLNTTGLDFEYDIWLSSPALDASENGNRGGDLVLVKRLDDNRHQALQLIDVSLTGSGNPDSARRKAKPGVNRLIDSATISVTTGMNGLQFGRLPYEFMDATVRGAISQGWYQGLVERETAPEFLTDKMTAVLIRNSDISLTGNDIIDAKTELATRLYRRILAFSH